MNSPFSTHMLVWEIDGLFMKDHLLWAPFMTFLGKHVGWIEKGRSLSVSRIPSQALPECQYMWSAT